MAHWCCDVCGRIHPSKAIANTCEISHSNPRRTKAASRFIARRIKKEFVGGKRPMKQAIAIAYSKAREKGYKIPRTKKVRWPKDW